MFVFFKEKLAIMQFSKKESSKTLSIRSLNIYMFSEHWGCWVET